MTAPVTGRCFCGAIRYRFDEAPIVARACWCRDCQYIAAGNASVNAMFRKAAFTLDGDPAVYVSTADSGNVMRRSFCARCGTHLFSEAENRPEIIVVRAGTLDDSSITRPSRYIWTASAPEWGYVDDSLLNCEGQPPPVST